MNFLKRLFGAGKAHGSPDQSQAGRETFESHPPPPKGRPQSVPAPADDLFNAAKNGDAATIRALLRKGVNVNAKMRDGTTALMQASFNSYRGDPVKSVQALLAKGADVNARDGGGKTALMLAAYGEKNSEVIHALLGKGANVNAKDNKGGTVLMLASWYGNLELAKILLAKGAERQRHE